MVFRSDYFFNYITIYHVKAKRRNVALRVTTLFLTIIAVLSCNTFGAATPESKEHSFLPGECLNSPNMTFYPDIFYDPLHHPRTIGYFVDNNYMEDPGIADIRNSATITLSFSLDMNIETDVSGFWNTEYRYIPGSDVYLQFGSNSAKVSKEYERVYKDIDFSLSHGHGVAYSTVYYSGGMSLTADKTFLDFAPGDNIAPLAFLLNHTPWINEFEVPGILHESGGQILGRAFSMAIPVGGYEVFDESITFNLSVPVKVGMYLTWLNERLTDPDAELHYRDETLTCNFTITKNFR